MAAKRHGQKVIEAIKHLDPNGEYPIVGGGAIRNSNPARRVFRLVAKRENHPVAKRASFHDRRILNTPLKMTKKVYCASANVPLETPKTNKPKILSHSHCYQKSQQPLSDQYPSGVHATIAMLSASGYHVEVNRIRVLWCSRSIRI